MVKDHTTVWKASQKGVMRCNQAGCGSLWFSPAVSDLIPDLMLVTSSISISPP
jgi:hypothetical protein